MDADQIARTWSAADDPARPLAFLASTTGCASDIRRHLGSADYSYAFVLEALRPVLERLGTVRLIDRPESRLAYAAARAAADGFRPVHLALHPPHNIYLSPAVPTVLVPFWEFPHVPDRDFGADTRQNWVRMCGPASLILTASRDSAAAFRRAGVDAPMAVIPVPVSPEHFDMPAWDPEFTWSLTCRHLRWGGAAGAGPAAPPDAAGGRRRGLGGVKQALKGGYHRHIRPWLGERAIRSIGRAKRAVLRRPEGPPPRLPAAPLSLSGLVFTSIFNLGDRRKNPRDLLSAFLLAFRDRPDATLVIKLATSPAREYYELLELEALYRGLGIDHACEVIVLTDFLTDAQMAELLRATTFYVNTSHAEGACLPLQRALAAGRPAIAPAHTAMADYMDESVGFVVRSHPEPTYWPHDPDRRHETTWHRLVWSDVRDGLLHAAALADGRDPAYRDLSAAARDRMARHASPDVVAAALREALTPIAAARAGQVGWAA